MKRGDKKTQVKIQLPQERAGVTTVVFYSLASLLLLSYCVYLYDRHAFESALTTHAPALKPLTVAFDLVGAYSPFHEFIDDDMTEKSPKTSKEKPKQNSKKKIKAKVFTSQELRAHDGSDPSGKGPYLAFLGHVFDVSKGKEHYGPGGGYSFFAGRDASRAYVTGEFDEKGLSDDVMGLETDSYLGLEEWLTFYKSDYMQVGVLAGRYFDADGEPTEYTRQVRHLVEAAEAAKAAKLEEHDVFPPCNSAWSQDKGHKVWCTNKSGGIDRTWVGVPRRLFRPAHDGQERCACVKDSGEPLSSDQGGDSGGGRGDLDHPHLKEYPGCDPKADTCQLSPPEVTQRPETEEELNAEDLRLMHGMEL